MIPCFFAEVSLAFGDVPMIFGFFSIDYFESISQFYHEHSVFVWKPLSHIVSLITENECRVGSPSCWKAA